MINVDALLALSESAGATDLFVCAGKTPQIRVNGTLKPIEQQPTVEESTVVDFRKKCLGDLEKSYCELGSFDSAYDYGMGKRCRINFFSGFGGSSMAIRLLFNGGTLDFEKLGLPDKLAGLCRAPRGLILVTGSTGSGKTTTLGALINYINRNFCKHILTLEDPVEFVHLDQKSMVSQREVNFDLPCFAGALRSVLRENPDVIVIGEMRDKETVQTAINAALTGHLVISTLHTANAVQTVERIINLFPEHLQEQVALDLSLALNAILAQRLLPGANGSKMHPAIEALIGTSTVRQMISSRDYQGLEDVLERNGAEGMVPFNRAIFKLYKAGLVKLEDALFASDNPNEFNLLLRGVERGANSFRDRYGSGLDDGSLVDLRTLLRAAVKNGASDLILSAGASPTVRLNGEMVTMELPEMSDRDIQMVLFSLVSSRQRLELETKRELDFALAVPMNIAKDAKAETTVRFRVNCFYQRGTLGLVARVVNAEIPLPEKLGLPASLVKMTNKKQGLILVTGPTGSGKSTTLAALIDQINRNRATHIITIEDPIEYVHSNKMSIIEQRELHSDTPSFSSALKYALRQAPDVIMVGEMRDVETMAAALTAAETGHLVMATVHTNSSAQTIDRIVDSFPAMHQQQIRTQLASVLLAVVSQRLIAKNNGDGRAAAFEIMINTPPIQALIRDNKTFQIESVIQTGTRDGMCTLESALESLALDGQIGLDEARKFKVDFRPVNKF